MVQPIPEGYRTVTPYLTVDGAARLIDFVTEAFGAQESVRMDGPGGSISHAEVKIGDSVIMLADSVEGWPARPGRIHLYVEDCDATYQHALEAGATSIREPRTEFYGDRMRGVTDPVGNEWWIATHVEDPSPEELSKGLAERLAQAES